MKFFLSLLLLLATSAFAGEPEVRVHLVLGQSDYDFVGGPDGMAADFAKSLHTSFSVRVDGELITTKSTYTDSKGKKQTHLSGHYAFRDDVGFKEFRGAIPVDKSVVITIPFKDLEKRQGKKGELVFMYMNDMGWRSDGNPTHIASRRLDLDTVLKAIQNQGSAIYYFKGSEESGESGHWCGLKSVTKGFVTVEIRKECRGEAGFSSSYSA